MNTTHELNLAVLHFAASKLRERDSTALAQLGFGPEEIETLSQLTLAEFSALSRKMPEGILEVRLDKTAFRLMVEAAKHDTQQQVHLAKELILLGAPREMLSQLLGLGARDFSALRSILGRHSNNVGRPTVPQEAEARAVWLHWKSLGLEHPRLANAKDWLKLCQLSKQPAGTVWRLMWRWYKEDSEEEWEDA